MASDSRKRLDHRMKIPGGVGMALVHGTSVTVRRQGHGVLLKALEVGRGECQVADLEWVTRAESMPDDEYVTSRSCGANVPDDYGRFSVPCLAHMLRGLWGEAPRLRARHPGGSGSLRRGSSSALAGQFPEV